MSLGSPAPQAQCPGSTPVFPDQANQNPQYLQQCFNLPPGGGCPTAPPPGIVPGSTRAQEVQLTTQVPAGFTADEVWWTAYYYDDLGFLRELWTHRSIDGAPHAPGTQITFGAPGLKEETEMLFAVSFRGSSPGGQGVFCWSDWTHETTPGFSGDPPAKPADPDVQQLVEDTFSRPPTNPKCGPGPNGDGLGPAEVWLDCEGDSGHAVTIGQFCDDQQPPNCETAARGLPSTNMVYTGLVTTNPHNYAEAQVRVDLSESAGLAYNLQTQAWVQPGIWQGNQYLMSWNAKIIKGPRGCTEPTLFVVKLPHEYEIAKCVDPDMDGFGEPDPAALALGAAVECTEGPPLHVPDGTYSASQPAWLRIEIWRDDFLQKPVVKGTLAWGDCPPGQGIDNCAHVCSVTRPADPAAPDDLSPEGSLGAFFHEHPYFVKPFRGGGE